MSAPIVTPVEAEPGFGRALDLFQRTARHVPAYAEFLTEHGIDPSDVRTPEDFAAVPPTTKTDYLQRYRIDRLLWHGDITGAGTWSCSSGSSGHPTYWPRDMVALDEGAELYARILRHCFESPRRSTLLVIGFAMGNWIGGTYTYAAALALRRRGLPVSVIAPGIEPDTILENIERLGPHYEQVVLAGYPPFVKDVLDRAPETVLRHDIRLLLAGEAITERFRDHMLDRIGKTDRPTEICLVYGTADAGIMGHETPTTIAVRRAARTDAALGRELFGGDPIQPTFVEYDAGYRFTEVDPDGYFLFTSDSSIPLVRYRINDQGRILSADALSEALRAHGYRLPVRPSTETCGYLALHRRTDIAAAFYGLQIYPENVRAALEHADLADIVSGKFVLSVRSDEQFTQTLALRVELRTGVTPAPGFRDRLRQRVIAALDRTNGEYRRLHQTLGVAAEPDITMHDFGSAGFGPGIKHQWTDTRS
ncbi:phenylacetate--CoA ligase family protein [Nocardia otitidiscaviarum]|uniref:phenylacetate--CoA ligase family protein n=1 Tax=Nocardia otitidiscaviarum TaxID=1823 RepID=UPI001FD0071A|nr:phenylacetate--CoA ligase family protein [Nocardia otitidiscaviarum]MCP9618673.1 phenylacetate--CoA ligase family protein [Nocardia otitidiscaviarum]